MHPLDQLSSLQAYTRLFTNAHFWTPYVSEVCARHAIPCHQVKIGLPGTCPAFIVDRRVFVKFFGALFNGQRSFAVEQSIAHLLADNPQFPAAALLGEGTLDPPGADWHWPYLIFNFLEGKSYGEVRQQISPTERTRLARQMGVWVRALHAIPVPRDGTFEADWSGFAAFLTQQRHGSAARHAAWGSLPERLVSQVEGYLLPVSALIDFETSPHIIHADLTADHLLGQITADRWITQGLIDFGDARTGNLYYELPALHLDFFLGDPNLLSAFLDSYGFNPPPDFSRRALSYCLLHEFDLFTNPDFIFKQLQECASLADLADHLWHL